jgi:hypothetical protein
VVETVSIDRSFHYFPFLVREPRRPAYFYLDNGFEILLLTIMVIEPTICRLSYGNHEGTLKAFGFLYRGFCNHLIAKKTGGDPDFPGYFTVHDGVRSLTLINVCFESNT